MRTREEIVKDAKWTRDLHRQEMPEGMMLNLILEVQLDIRELLSTKEDVG